MWTSCTGDSTKTDTTDGTDNTDSATDTPTDTTDSDTNDTTDTGDDRADATFDAVLPAFVESTTTGAGDDESGTCGGTGQPDFVVRFVAPAAGDYAFVTSNLNFDAVLFAIDESDDTELGCIDDKGPGGEALIVTLGSGDSVLVAVDGGAGDFRVGAYEAPGSEADCNNQFDDDFDGITDCADSDCAATALCLEDCADGIDNGGNGIIDCADAVCAKDPLCLPQCPDLVASGVLPEVLTADTIGDLNEFSPSCTKAKTAGDVYIEYTAPRAGSYLLDLVGSDYDTTLAVLDGCGGTELACNDDTIGTASQVVVALTKGQTVIVAVDGRGHQEGNFSLQVDELQATETDCADGRDVDNDGLVDCFDSDCFTDSACAEICDNGIDDNGNGLADCFDADYCVSDISCFEDCDNGIDDNGNGDVDCFDQAYCGSEDICFDDCDNGIDDNGDGTIDCQDEAACSDDPACADHCPDEVADTVPLTLEGDILGNHDEVEPSCGSFSYYYYYKYKYKYEGFSSGDQQVEYTAPAGGTYVFDLVGSDYGSTISLFDSCGGKELACDYGFPGFQPQVTHKMKKGDTVIVNIDGYYGDEGNYVLNVAELEASETDCADGRDLDDDGDVDCFDSDCTSAKVCEEICDNNVDDNGTGRVDCQDEDYCAKDAACLADCPDVVAAGTASDTVTGEIVGNYDEIAPSCATFSYYYKYKYYKYKYSYDFPSSGDVQVEYTAPATDDYVFDTVGSNYAAALSIHDSCKGKELDCSVFGPTGQAQLVHTMKKGDVVIVNVDGYYGEEGDFVLNIDPLQSAESDCDDGRDLDNDGDVDCFDSDCTDDPVCEETCDNHLDDNGTGLVDCQDEAYCAKDDACQPDCPDVVADGTLPETLTGSILGNYDEIEASCASYTYKYTYKYYKGKKAPKPYVFEASSGDEQIEYTAPQTGDYVFDTVGSDFPAALTFHDGCGGKELDCETFNVGKKRYYSGDAMLVRTLKKGDTIIVNVDGYYGSEGSYTLNIAELETSESDCTDGRDLDDDGAVDCDDSDCAKDPAC